jgi:hypothetical protein
MRMRLGRESGGGGKAREKSINKGRGGGEGTEKDDRKRNREILQRKIKIKKVEARDKTDRQIDRQDSNRERKRAVLRVSQKGWGRAREVVRRE